MAFPETDNSPVYWEVQRADGTWFSLHTYAWSVKSFGGRRWFAGAKRGENVQLPHRRGRLYVPKNRESQTYDINMWVLPLNADGSKDPDKTVEQKAHENWRQIIDAVDQEGQFLIRKRWYPDDSTRDTFRTDIASAIGQAEFIDGSGPDTDDGRGYYTNLTFSLADPYFYGNTIIDGFDGTDKAATATTLANNSTTSLTVTGDAPTDHIWLSFSSMSTSNPKITFPDGNWVQVLSSAMTDQTSNIVVDLRNGLAIRKPLSDYLDGDYDGTYVNGLVRRNPYFSNWPTLDPMKGSTAVITTAGSGTMKIVYDPAYR